MDNIVDILGRRDLRHTELERAEESQEAEDRFLVDEGLGLLAAYRAIGSVEVRYAIRTLAEALAMSKRG